MKLNLVGAGTYTTAIKFSDARGYHEDLSLQMTAGVTVTNGFIIDTAAQGIFAHGVVIRGGGILTNGLVNNSGYFSHDIIIRDIEGGLVYNAVGQLNPKQEIVPGVVDGVNDTFTPTAQPYDEDSILIMVDGVPRLRNTHWNLVGPDIIFNPGFIPQTGQDVYAYYVPRGTFSTPPRHLEVLNSLVSVLFNTKKINLGTGLAAVLDSPEQVTISATGLVFVWESYFHTVSGAEITAKQLTLTSTPSQPTKLMVDIPSLGGAKKYSVDFTVSGAVVDWTGLALDGVLTAGMEIRFSYFY
jgi:hypothetical protein